MILVILAVVLIFVAIALLMRGERERKGTPEELSNKARLDAIRQRLIVAAGEKNTCEELIFGYHFKWGFTVDNKNKKIYLLSPRETHVLNFDNIISVSLNTEKGTYSKRDVKEVAKRHIIGSIIAGDTGSRIGTYTAKTHIHTYCKNIEIKILLRDAPVPSITIPCYSQDMLDEDTSEEALHKMMAKVASEVTDRLYVAIDNAKREEKRLNAGQRVNNTQQDLLSAEILRLAQLCEKGFITMEEYNAAKAKLLYQERGSINQ